MFENPWFLSLLAVIPVVIWGYVRRNREAGVSFSSAITEWKIRPTWRQRLAWLPKACTLAALALMLIALARPREGREQTQIDAEGIAIELVVDRSSSMQARDFKIDGAGVDRLMAIKNVAGRFIQGDDEDDEKELGGRVSDLVGLVTFAGYADAITPPTLDHQFLVDQLENAQIVSERSEDGTAIGDAISLAVEKLDSLDRGREDKIKSKVVILLTDGENTAGEIEPQQAAEMAKAMDVKVYTIGVGTRGVAPVPTRHPFTGRIVLRNMEVNIDEDTLREIAQTTNGKYFRATDTHSLEAIYAEIDEMEKTKVESKSFVDYRELAVQPIRLASTNLPPLLLLSLLLLGLRVGLENTILRSLP